MGVLPRKYTVSGAAVFACQRQTGRLFSAYWGRIFRSSSGIFSISAACYSDLPNTHRQVLAQSCWCVASSEISVTTKPTIFGNWSYVFLGCSVALPAIACHSGLPESLVARRAYF